MGKGEKGVQQKQQQQVKRGIQQVAGVKAAAQPPKKVAKVEEASSEDDDEEESEEESVEEAKNSEDSDDGEDDDEESGDEEDEDDDEEGSGDEESDEKDRDDDRSEEEEEAKEKDEDEEQEEAEDDVALTVFVSGISYSTTEDELRKFFNSSGTVRDIRMPRYQDSGKPMGYAHVDFTTALGAANACKRSGEVLSGRYLDIKMARDKNSKHFAKPKSKEKGCTTIFIKNLPYSTDEAQLEALFKGSGAIKSVRLGLDSMTGRMKGFAYIEFMRTESVDKAIQMNGKLVGGRKIHVDYETGRPRASYKQEKFLSKRENKQ